MAEVTEIKTSEWSVSLKAGGEIVEGLEDINQCIGIILITEKGSDPLRPEFGADIRRFIDRPVNQSVPNIIREVYDAISIWEPRAMLTSVTATVDISTVTIRINWKRASSENQTTITINR